MNASMLSYIILSGLLLSVQAQCCCFSEIIRFTNHLLGKSSVSCPCRETPVSSCSCLPIAEPGYELACFVEGTKHMMQNNVSSNELQVITLLNRNLQTQLERKMCKSLAHGDQCRYKTKGNVKEFLNKILRTYQAISKSNVKSK